jgi:hypothetical protein
MSLKSDIDLLKRSGGLRWLILAISMFAVGVIAYVAISAAGGGIFVSTGIYVAILSLGIGFGIVALTELRFYEMKVTLRTIDRGILDLKKKFGLGDTNTSNTS